MKKILAAVLFALSIMPAYGQGQTADNSILVGRGAGKTGYKSVGPCAAGEVIGGTGGVPSCQAARQVLISNRTLYVACSTGNDNNNGLSASTPFQTRQKAWNTIQQNYDLAGKYVVTVQALETGCANEAFAAQGPIVGAFNSSGQSAVVFQGCAGTAVGMCTASPDAAAISYTSTTGQNVWQAISGAQFTIKYFTGASIGGSGNGRVIEAYSDGVVLHSNMIFGATTDRHIDAGGPNGYIGAIGDYTITGGARFHAVAELSGIIGNIGRTVTLTGTPAFSEAFVQSDFGGGQEWTGASFVGGATGKRHAIVGGGYISTGVSNANFFPGNAAGISYGGFFIGNTGFQPCIWSYQTPVSPVSFNTTSCTVEIIGTLGAVLASDGTATGVTFTRTPTLGVNGTQSGRIDFKSTTAGGGFSLNPSTNAGAVAWNFNAPATQGAPGTLLTTQGDGTDMTWTSPTMTVNGTACTLGSTCSPTAAPSGAAGGSLSGTYPNPTVATNANLTGEVTSVGNTTTMVGASGTFTPGVLYGINDCTGGGTPCTFTTRTCTYNKSARQVTIECYIVFTAVGSAGAAGDTVKLNNLPYTSASTFYIPFHSRVTNMAATIGDLTALVYPSDTVIGELDYMSGGTAVALTRAGLTDTTTMSITGTYLTP